VCRRTVPATAVLVLCGAGTGCGETPYLHLWSPPVLHFHILPASSDAGGKPDRGLARHLPAETIRRPVGSAARRTTMRMHCVALSLLAVAALTAGGCAERGGSGPGAGGATPAPSATASSAGGANLAGTMPPASEPTGPDMEYRVSYNWGVPSNRVTVDHPLTAPLAPPPAPGVPYLVAIYVGDHPEGNPKYGRISFYFRGAFPSYNFQYVPQVLNEGQGAPISLEGNSFLRIQFVDAITHDAAGHSTIKVSPNTHIGFPSLKGYGFGGDYEGYVTYGLGIQVAPNSDQVRAIRTGELKKPDGSGGFYYVVHFDVRND
jgi:hypothetical protein